MTTEIILPGESAPPDKVPKWELRMPARPATVRFEDKDISFGELWCIVRRRKKIIGIVCVSVFALAVLYTVLVTPKYQATTSIEFNKQNEDALGLDVEHEMLGEANSGDYGVTQQTEVKMLQSETLALQVISELGLEKRSEFSKRQSLMDYFRPRPNESGLSLDQAPYRRMNILKAYQKSLRVEPVSGTRMINIEFLGPDAQMSATVANRLVADFKEQYFQSRYAATMESSGWLSKQLVDLKNEVETSQQRLVDYQKEVGILGTDETHNIVMTRLEELNKQVMTSESNRILSETVVHLVRNGNAELIPGLVSPSTSSGSSMSKEALTSLEGLKSQKRLLELEYAEDSTKYGSAHPRLVELQSKRNQTDIAIQDEVKRLGESAEVDFMAARDIETGLRASFEREKEDANKLNDSAIQYTILKHEVESNRALYDGLLKKLKETGLLAGLRSSNIIIVDPARATYRPARPIVPLNLAVGLFGGLLMGVVFAFVAENMDDCVNTADDAERIAMVPSLGMIPRWKRRANLQSAKHSSSLEIRETGMLVVSQSRSQPAEAFRAIRTSIIQSIRPGVSTVILVTSPLPCEGKTTVALNCAAAFAQQRARVLLVEADLRRPKLRAQLNLTVSKGLTSMISGEQCADLPVKLPGLPYLSVVPAGMLAAFPAELLASEGMSALIKKWRGEYDYIIFDTPPVMAVTDAVVLAAYCDVVVLVAKSRTTTKQSLQRARTLFLRSQSRVLGVIVNCFDPNSPDYASYYGYDSKSEAASGYFTPVAQ
jgi:capsular exopolysaccharide synthesis family protein